MRCCENCFSDKEVRGFISYNSTEKNNCSFCNSEQVPVVDPRELEEMFLPLLEIYEPISSDTEERESSDYIHKKIQQEWSVFSTSLSPEIQLTLLQSVVSNSKHDEDLIFANKVQRLSELLKNQWAKNLEDKWEKFKEEIIFKNRYILSNSIDRDILKPLFRIHTKVYSKGKLFYRARISDANGFDIDQMGKPPPEKSPSGRANPEGIPYFYVSSPQKTVLYESRATHMDYVTIAEFRVKDRLRVVSLRKIDLLSPFQAGDELADYLKNQKYLKRLEQELSKPLRRNDRRIEYLPTQYICEYVKSLEYDAIEYGSSLHENGLNLAIFNDKKLEASNLEVHEITSVSLGSKVVKKNKLSP